MEWAETYRVLPAGSAVSGRWVTSRVEPARAVMEAVTQKGVRKISVMVPSQMLKTDLLLNTIGYFVHQDPTPIMVMQPDLETADAFSKDRVTKMIESTPALKTLFADKSKKTSQDSIRYKAFPGGSLTLVGSNAPSGLAMRAVRVVLVDELDRAAKSAGHEGSPLLLLEKRTTTFWNSLSIRVSTPTITNDSAIQREYELGDKRVWHSKCPHCLNYEEPKWAQVRWDRHDDGTHNTDSARYECSHCAKPWTEPQRIKAISKGKYIATAPFADHASFKCNAIASPWVSIKQLVDEWLIAKDDTDALKTFVNTRLAETFTIKGDKPEWERLFERRESYVPNTIPTKQILFMTCGVDVQKDRLELEIVGWARDKQSWSIDYRVIYGETHTPEPWAELDKVLQETWKTPAGLPMQISVMCVDSGYNTQSVYEFTRKHPPYRVRAVKGKDDLATKFGMPSATDVNSAGDKVKRGARVWPVGVSLLKSELYGWLKMFATSTVPPGFCHFPQYDEEHFRRLCSEQLVEVRKKGRISYEWQKVHQRNEQLDVRNYNRAAAAMFGLDTMRDEDWAMLEGVTVEEAQSPAVVESTNAPRSSAWTHTSRVTGKGKGSLW